MKKSLFRKILRYLGITLLTLIILVVVCLQVFFYLNPFRSSDEQIREDFKGSGIEPQIHRYQAGDRTMRYVQVGEDTARLVLFVHGAPGAYEDFLGFMKDSSLYNRACLISVDRPGYGDSGYGKTVISIEEQAAMIQPILALNQHEKPPILVGHSYGGPVVARMAMDYPDLVGPLVMAAPAIDPENEIVFWVSYPLDWIPFRWLMPTVLRVTNDEKMSHAAELEKMLPYWKDIKVPTTFIHGQADELVPFVNSEFGVKKMVNASVDTMYKDDMNHLIPWHSYDVLKEAIMKYLEE